MKTRIFSLLLHWVFSTYLYNTAPQALAVYLVLCGVFGVVLAEGKQLFVNFLSGSILLPLRVIGEKDSERDQIK